jgi:hypothetical protein
VKLRMPWDDVPGDDGYRWSLNVARTVCAGITLFPVLFLACMLAILAVSRHALDGLVLTVAFAVLAIVILPAAPLVRERLAQVGIKMHLEGQRPLHGHRPVYATFASGTIAAFMIAQAPALFGFIVSALTHDLRPLGVGSAASYATWAVLWPRKSLWARWSWQAKIDSPGEALAESPDGSAAEFPREAIAESPSAPAAEPVGEALTGAGEGGPE